MKREFERLADGPFDVLVIGGGIYGAWSAYDASRRGLRVALVEKRDWAAGTSSASSKLIHGGLRYLQYRRFGLVRKSLDERRRLLRLAPHRVQPLRFVVPVYRNARVGRLRLKAGLWIYDRLAGDPAPVPRHAHVDRRTFGRRYAPLRTEDLRAAYTYGDAVTDDARLTLDLVRGVIEAGGVAVNRARVEELLVTGKTVRGARVRDGLGRDAFDVRARVTLDCAGAWSSALLPPSARSRFPPLRLTKGVHLSMPPLPFRDAVLLMADDPGRVTFLIPWYGRTLLGTTDTAYDGDPDRVQVEGGDVSYLLDQARRVLRAPWTEDDVGGSFAGLRTLVGGPRAAPSALSREFLVVEPLENLIVPLGGKLTSARVDASRLVDRAGARVGRSRRTRCDTGKTTLPGTPPGRFRRWVRESGGRGLTLGLDEPTVDALQHRHGARVDDVYALIESRPDLAQPLLRGLPFCFAEVLQAARCEMATDLDDVLRRRVPAALLGRLDEPAVRRVASLVAEELAWSAHQVEREVSRFLAPAEPQTSARESA